MELNPDVVPSILPLGSSARFLVRINNYVDEPNLLGQIIWNNAGDTYNLTPEEVVQAQTAAGVVLQSPPFTTAARTRPLVAIYTEAGLEATTVPFPAEERNLLQVSPWGQQGGRGTLLRCNLRFLGHVMHSLHAPLSVLYHTIPVSSGCDICCLKCKH